MESSLVGNRYWVLRHGKSIPNERGLIENGVLPEFQLAPDGVAQARLAGEFLLKQLEECKIALDKVRICYSPFSRTTHTARIVAEVLNLPFHAPHCKTIEDLRERYFGPTFELKSHDKYAEIWALDEKDPFMRPPGGKSADDVVSRLAKAMESMETDYQRFNLADTHIPSITDCFFPSFLHRIPEVCNSGGESWRSSADVAERFPFCNAPEWRWFGREDSDDPSSFCLVTAPQLCFAHWGTPTPPMIGNLRL